VGGTDRARFEGLLEECERLERSRTTMRRTITVDGNEAAASVAYRSNEVIAIYPITPASPMGELADEWSANHRPNLWGVVPEVIEMQSEGGAAGAIHGALQAGALATTFTASQGLLLMIPNMYKIAGELTPFCLHVAARTLATHALSIFGDHSDVMACRQTGFAMLASASVQEAHDFALIAHAATLEARVPFLHFFDGFRTSHEIASIEPLDDDDLRALLDERAIAAHKTRAMTPDAPVLRGTAQNPDVFFQAREACNPFYEACPDIVERTMRDFGDRVGRRYGLFDYAGHPQAEHVIVVMGSGAETVERTALREAATGRRVGVVKVRLYRPFDVARFAAALPASVRSIAVLDRTKEPGAVGEPLFQDVVTALVEAKAQGGLAASELPVVIGGRYGLSSKEFTPAMAKAVFDELGKERPKRRFTVGIIDDVTHLSLEVDPDYEVEPRGVVRAVFFGLGSDGTVGANKNTIKIIAEATGQHAQGYFVYDSKKAGAATVSHLRFGPEPIHAPYLIERADFVGCHQMSLLERFDVLAYAREGAAFLLNAPHEAKDVWGALTREVQDAIVEKKLRLYTIDAYALAREVGVGARINTIMQTCFFAISGVLPRDEAIDHIKDSIRKTYERKGPEVLRRNSAAVDAALAHLHEVPVARATATRRQSPPVPAAAPDFVQRVTAVILAGKGDSLPVSAMPVDGTWPTGTSKWEKRRLAMDTPVWDSELCIQCNKCALSCPHAAIRAKVYDPPALEGAPEGFASTAFRSREHPDQLYTLHVAPEDCTGCRLCVEVCPARDKANPRRKALEIAPLQDRLDAERDRYAFFLEIPEIDRASVAIDVKTSQFLEPLFEYSGACAGCGETPYLKLLTQLFGDRLMIANATGCSSIYGGNLPTTPYTVNGDGRGPVWSNSLFEDNAEFGLGFRLSVDFARTEALALLAAAAGRLGDELVSALVAGVEPCDEAGIAAQRERVKTLRAKLAALPGDDVVVQRLGRLADYLVPKSVWIVGGDGWAYDIGFGGLDHVLATGRNVNILVLDTEVYSNTGGQQSKATPLAAAAKFAIAGKATGKKDLGMMAMTYGTAYVARIAFGAKDQQTLRALVDADAYPGPSLVIAYSHCIAHGYDLAFGARQQKLAVDSGVWPLYRFDPRRGEAGEPPLHLDSPRPRARPTDYMRNETRFRIAEKVDPENFRALVTRAEKTALERYAVYEQLAGVRLLTDKAENDEK
jgi:pyruvate-ferredoxin/flavodoxin oxidoreductase